MTHKLNIETIDIYAKTISVWYYIDGIESEECSHYLVLREAFDLWVRLNGKLKGTETSYCQVTNTQTDFDWEITLEDYYQDYTRVKDDIEEYLISNKLIAITTSEIF